MDVDELSVSEVLQERQQEIKTSYELKFTGHNEIESFFKTIDVFEGGIIKSSKKGDRQEVVPIFPYLYQETNCGSLINDSGDFGVKLNLTPRSNQMVQ